MQSEAQLKILTGMQFYCKKNSIAIKQVHYQSVIMDFEM